MSIDWPCAPVVGGVRAEEAVARALRPTAPGGWNSEEARHSHLPDHRLAEIEAACHANGMALEMAMSLRRHIIMSQIGPRRFHALPGFGSPQGAQGFADLFEEAVASFLRAQGADFLTENDLKEQMRNGERERGPTPDVLFAAPVRIGGALVRWIDCKSFYGSIMVARRVSARPGSPEWMPLRKLEAQAKKYTKVYGPGAFVFARGFAQGLPAGGAALLDATPLDMTDVNAYSQAQKDARRALAREAEDLAGGLARIDI